MKLLTYLLILSLLITTSYADCPKVKELNINDPAPCKGLFFNDKAAKTMTEDHNRLKQTVDNQKKALELSDLQIQKLNEKSDSWQSEAERQALMVQKTKNDFKWGVVAGVGGTLIMVLITGYTLSKVRR